MATQPAITAAEPFADRRDIAAEYDRVERCDRRRVRAFVRRNGVSTDGWLVLGAVNPAAVRDLEGGR